MIQFLASYIKLVHVAVIVYTAVKIVTGSTSKFPYDLFVLQLLLTLVTSIISRAKFDSWQIIYSLSLTYTLIPNNFRYVAGLFFLKMIYINKILGEVSDQLFANSENIFRKFFRVIFNITRFTVVEYLFLGLTIFSYKAFTKNDTEGQLPEDYVLLYKFIVTATTIGYGDVTPKTRLQIYFFTYTIPFICASFAIYFNLVIPLVGELIDILSGGTTTQGAQALKSAHWSKEEQEGFQNFIGQVSKRQADIEDQHKRLGNNWIAIAAANYQKQIPIISEILSGSENKETKLLVSSKIRQQHYPKGWTIINEGDTCEDMIMIEEGEVEVIQPNAKIMKKKGDLINKSGFFTRILSQQTVVTVDFVTVWAISLKDLDQVLRINPKLNAAIQDRARFYA